MWEEEKEEEETIKNEGTAWWSKAVRGTHRINTSVENYYTRAILVTVQNNRIWDDEEL